MTDNPQAMPPECAPAILDAPDNDAITLTLDELKYESGATLTIFRVNYVRGLLNEILTLRAHLGPDGPHDTGVTTPSPTAAQDRDRVASLIAEELRIEVAKIIEPVWWIDLMEDGQHSLNNYKDQHLRYRAVSLDRADKVLKLLAMVRGN